MKTSFRSLAVALALALAAQPALAANYPSPTFQNTTVLGVYTQGGVALPQPIAAATTIASAATVDLGTLASHSASVTGSVGITSFGSSASTLAQFYFVSFTGAPTITASANILTPTGTNLQVVANSSALLAYLGSGKWQVVTYTPPAPADQVTVYATGSGTYTTPTGATELDVEEVGGGSGGGGSGITTTGGSGGVGGDTTFGAGLTAHGGPATPASGTGFAYPAAATATGGDSNVPGGLGGGQALNPNPAVMFGSAGAASFYGAGGPGATAFAGTIYTPAGTPGAPGAGGGGGTANVGSIPNIYTGWGGNAGAYLKKTITSPAATYAYSVGAAGTAGAAGTDGSAGAPGQAGSIRITAKFQWVR